jgi:hypothetical protein
MCAYCSIKDLVESMTPTLVVLIICCTLVVLLYSCSDAEYKKKQQMIDAGYKLETVTHTATETKTITESRWVKSSEAKAK